MPFNWIPILLTLLIILHVFTYFVTEIFVMESKKTVEEKIDELFEFETRRRLLTTELGRALYFGDIESANRAYELITDSDIIVSSLRFQIEEKILLN